MPPKAKKGGDAPPKKKKTPPPPVNIVMNMEVALTPFSHMIGKHPTPFPCSFLPQPDDDDMYQEPYKQIIRPYNQVWYP